MTNGEVMIKTIESVMGVEFEKSFNWRELNSHDVVIAFSGSWWRKERGMIIDIGTGVDESVVKWKYNDKDRWRDADIDELIHLYESIVHCKDCRHADECHKSVQYTRNEPRTVTIGYAPIDFCSHGERKEP